MFTHTLRLIVGGAALSLAIVTAPAANIPVVPGLNAITIPTLISLNYSANNVFSTAYEGDTIYRWNPVPGAWTVFNYFDGVGWDPIAPTFFPGEGMYYYAVVAQTFVCNFHLSLAGNEPPPPRRPAAYAALAQNTYYFQGSPTGESATYEDVFGEAPNNETALMRFIPGSPNIDPIGGSYYNVYYYTDGVWSPETPVLNPLEPAFVVYPYLKLKYTVSGPSKKIDFTWPARGKLQEGDSPKGPWRLVDTADNTYSVTPDPDTPPRYYRVIE